MSIRINPDERVLYLPKARQRWEATLAQRADIASLKAAVKDGGGQNPCIIGLRSVCWKVGSTLTYNL